MKKIIGLMLCFILIFSIIGCGSGTEVINETDNENKDTEFKDMNEARFIFGTIRTNEYFEDEGYSSAGDKMRKRYKETAEKFNCTLDVIKLENDACAPIIMQAVAVMTDVPDFIDCNSDAAYTLYKEGVLFAYDDMTTLDINDSRWGPASFRANGIFNDKSYGVFNYDWEFIPQVKGILLINNPLLKIHGMTDPYELQEKNAWNWDNFKAELVKGTFDDSENTYIGMTCEDINKVAFVSALSNGARVVSEVDGKKVFSFDSPEAIQGFDYAASLMKEKLIKASPGNLADFTGGSLESDGTASYAFCNSWMGTIHIAGTEYLPSFLMNEYGFINFPNGPAASENNCASYIGNERLLWCIEPGDNETDDKGMIMNYVFSPLDDSEKEGWKKLSDVTFHHTQDYKNFLNMVENSSYNYDTQLGTDIATRLNTALGQILTTAKTPAAVMESISEVINTQLKTEYGE
ncbi:MAG: extracellular solute-binding protein family 1 [Clostridia bacterium]|nr:extracellular solute-binding protein family 1 [Clostridia bacterium]